MFEKIKLLYVASIIHIFLFPAYTNDTGPMTVQPTMAPVSMEPRTMEPEVLEPDTTEPEIFGPVASQLQITASTTINALRSITPTSRVLSSTLPMATGLANGFTVTPQISSTRDLFPSPSPEPTTLPEPETTDGSGIVETTEPATSEQETTDVGATEPATTAPPGTYVLLRVERCINSIL